MLNWAFCVLLTYPSALRTKRLRFGLELCARLENIKEFYVDPTDTDVRWYMKLKCTGCGEVVGKKDDRWVYLDGEVHKTQNGQSANFVTKCKSCKREMTINILQSTLKSYKFDEDKPDGCFREVVQFEARGVEPVEFDLREGFHAISANSNSSFQNLEISSGDWVEYDEKSDEPVGVYDVKSRFVKA